jgi:hydrogenase maturation protein HypF
VNSELGHDCGSAAQRARLKVTVRGAVQGVGFRPFVYRLARELGLRGWVSNSAAGVFIEVESDRGRLEDFQARLRTESPPRSRVQAIESAWLEPAGYADFEIRGSDETQSKTTLVLPDIATCQDCLREILDPRDRRFGYPFTNCTNCGPRFTIIEALPYDRVRTSMKSFSMCPECEREYEDPLDRRFHAQPNACPRCGPRLALWNQDGQTLEREQAALEAAAVALAQGAIVAVKGLGGFHLMTAPHLEESVARLRQLKRREGKPFALMFPTLAQARRECEVSALEEELLCSPEAPIVLLRRQSPVGQHPSRISSLVAPGNPYLGVMLPATPLHHLLLRKTGFPVIATSGNLAEEPICIDEREALQRLGDVASLFLVHDRPIVRHADDSIARVIAGREMLLRRARGYAPLPVDIRGPSGPTPIGSERVSTDCVLAVGAHLKNTVALAVGPRVFISQHIGDLETAQAYAAFQRVIADFESFYGARPGLIAADAHPDYLSTRYARSRREPVLPVQHHYAHVLSCMAENGLEPPVLGVSWDGTGFGSDGTVWGGEFLVVTSRSFERLGHIRTFGLPGGDKAVKEPRRSALGLLYAAEGEAAFDMKELAPLRAFSQAELAALRTMLRQKLNTPVTSSAGRLFDAVAALAGLRQRSAFEGQAAMDLEFALDGFSTDESYPFAWLSQRGPEAKPGSAPSDRTSQVLDWGPMLAALLADLEKRLPAGLISMKFHNGLVEAIGQVAQHAGLETVALSGGCFQNKYLTERAVEGLKRAGFRPHCHRWTPPNDGGIALGQALAARRLSEAE